MQSTTCQYAVIHILHYIFKNIHCLYKYEYMHFLRLKSKSNHKQKLIRCLKYISLKSKALITNINNRHSTGIP